MIEKDINLATTYMTICVIKNWINILHEFKDKQPLNAIMDGGVELIKKIEYNFKVKIKLLSIDLQRTFSKEDCYTPADINKILKQKLDEISEGL